MPRQRQEQTGFDLWLHRGLSAAYGGALLEPLPDELERLVAALPERERDR